MAGRGLKSSAPNLPVIEPPQQTINGRTLSILALHWTHFFISAAQPGNGNNLVLGLSLVRIDGNGSSVITVTTKKGAGNRGVFLVNVTTDPACGSGAKLTVSVSN